LLRVWYVLNFLSPTRGLLSSPERTSTPYGTHRLGSCFEWLRRWDTGSLVPETASPWKRSPKTSPYRRNWRKLLSAPEGSGSSGGGCGSCDLCPWCDGGTCKGLHSLSLSKCVSHFLELRVLVGCGCGRTCHRRDCLCGGRCGSCGGLIPETASPCRDSSKRDWRWRNWRTQSSK